MEKSPFGVQELHYVIFVFLYLGSWPTGSGNEWWMKENRKNNNAVLSEKFQRDVKSYLTTRCNQHALVYLEEAHHSRTSLSELNN